MMSINNYNKLIAAMLEDSVVEITFKNHVIPTLCFVKSLTALRCTILCNAGTFDISLDSIKRIKI